MKIIDNSLIFLYYYNINIIFRNILINIIIKVNLKVKIILKIK